MMSANRPSTATAARHSGWHRAAMLAQLGVLAVSAALFYGNVQVFHSTLGYSSTHAAALAALPIAIGLGWVALLTFQRPGRGMAVVLIVTGWGAMAANIALVGARSTHIEGFVTARLGLEVIAGNPDWARTALVARNRAHPGMAGVFLAAAWRARHQWDKAARIEHDTMLQAGFPARCLLAQPGRWRIAPDAGLATRWATAAAPYRRDAQHIAHSWRCRHPRFSQWLAMVTRWFTASPADYWRYSIGGYTVRQAWAQVMPGPPRGGPRQRQSGSRRADDARSRPGIWKIGLRRYGRAYQGHLRTR